MRYSLPLQCLAAPRRPAAGTDCPSGSWGGGGGEGRAEARLVPGGRRPPGPDSGERRNVNDTLQILLHGYL